MAGPTFVSTTSTAWNTTTSPKTTGSISVQAGDIIVCKIVGESGAIASSSVTDSGGNTWTTQQEYGAGNSNVPYVALYAATAKATASITVSASRSPSGTEFGQTTEVWRDGVIGVSGQANGGTTDGSPSLTLTTGQDNSAISVASGDWNAHTGTYTWPSTAGTPTNEGDFADNSVYGAHTAYYPDTSTAGSKTVGMSSPANQRWGIVGREIKGPAGGGGTAVTGTLAATESGSDTASFSGSVAASGSLSAAETGSDTASFSGAVKASGTLTATESGADTASLSGSVKVSGSLAASETGSDTAAFAGAVSAPGVAGTLAATEAGSDTVAFSGSVAVSGALSATESGPDSAALSGSVGSSDVSGSLTAVESGDDSAAMAGTVVALPPPPSVLPIGPLKGGTYGRSIVGRFPASSLRRI